jgi:hypothetical protein
MESFANVHVAADTHAHPRFSNPHYLKSRECREPSEEIHDAPILAMAFTSRLRRANRMNVCDAGHVQYAHQQRFEFSRGFDVLAWVLQIRIAVQNILRNRKAPKRVGWFWKCFITLCG